MHRSLLAAVTVAVAGVTAQAVPQSQGLTFRAKTELVLVDVLVTNGNKPVEGFRAEDFDVRDAGVRQKVERLLVESMPIDLLIALDVSASLAGPRLNFLKSAVRAAVGALRPIDRVMLLNFSNDIGLASDWTSDRAQINQAINALEASGWTSLIDATFTALALPATRGHRLLVLLVTDGRDTSSWLPPSDVLKIAEESGATVYGVSTGPVARGVDAPASSLRARLMSDPTGSRALFVPVIVHDTGGELLEAVGPELDAAFVEVVNRFSRRYLLSYTPTGVAPGWHPIEVRVKDPKMKVVARRGYTRR